MFEKRHQKLLPVHIFAKRMALHLAASIGLIAIALFLGVSGYHWLANLSWIDSLLNASMILGGMGPVDILPNETAKFFASMYALFSGLVFIAIMGIILAPILHRMLHAFHVEAEK